MAQSPRLYQRLPGTGKRSFESFRLYQASDHLLLVASTGFSETYRRFYFRDIQAFLIRQTRGRLLWNGIGAVLLGFSSFLLAFASDQGSVTGSLLAAAATLLVAIGVSMNTVRGPTCVCQIQTAVQTRPLPSLSRVKLARRILARLRPLIEAEQGHLTREELARRLDHFRPGAVPLGEASPGLRSPAESLEPSPPAV